jgi:hypothetical protein
MSTRARPVRYFPGVDYVLHPDLEEFRMPLIARLKAVASATMAILLLGSSPQVLAQTSEGNSARREAAELRIEELKKRLALTSEQEAKLAPIIEARNDKLRDLRASSDGDTSRRAKIAMLKKARKIQEDFSAQIEPILTEQQQAEWEKFRKETRDAAKERMRERR